MKQSREFPYRILIVEDEQRDWAEPMQEALKDAARDAGYVKLEMELAENYDKAERSIACRHFHVISMDMRLPERKNEIVSVETGMKLGNSFPYVGFPKRVIYSITLQEEHVRDHTRGPCRSWRFPAIVTLSLPVGTTMEKRLEWQC